jgi:multidrug efflux system membrane fusion protein
LQVEATIPNDPGPPETGTVTFVDNAMDNTTATIRLKATFANEKRRLWPGQFVNTVLTLTSERNAIVVPAEALQTGQNGQFVFVVKADGTVESRAVAVGRTVGGVTVIEKGVAEGETVVTDGQLRLIPGARVSVTSDTAPGAQKNPGGGAPVQH